MNKFKPDYAIPPGETLREIMAEDGITLEFLARRMRREPEDIEAIIGGEERITPELSSLLEAATGVPARLWNNLERDYRNR